MGGILRRGTARAVAAVSQRTVLLTPDIPAREPGRTGWASPPTGLPDQPLAEPRAPGHAPRRARRPAGPHADPRQRDAHQARGHLALRRAQSFPSGPREEPVRAPR